MQKKNQTQSQERFGDYGKALDFSYEDLQANRAGFMSFRHWQMMKKALRFMIFLSVGMDCFLCLLYGILWVSSPNKDSSILGPILIFALPILAWTWWAGRYVFRTWKDVKSRRVEKIITHIKKIRRISSRGSVRHFLVADELELELLSPLKEEIQWKPFAYIIYFLPYSKQILTLEEVLPESISHV